MSDVDEAALAAAAARVYAVAPEDFMPLRTELVKAARAGGDKALAAEIGRLRKPSMSAWALNLVAHQGSPVLAELSELGARMRSATSRLDVAELSAVRPERDRVLAALVAAAAEVVSDGGRTLSAAGRHEVRDTGIAALADAEAQAAIETGTLVRTLSYSGFGEVDVADAVAVTSTGRVLGVIRGGAGDSGKDPAADGAGADGAASESRPNDRPPTPADAATDDPAARRAAAQADLDAAEAAVRQANADVARAEELAESATERREAAQRQLEKAEAAESASREKVVAAKRARRAAEEARHAAEDALDGLG
jgi:hypothetical protein